MGIVSAQPDATLLQGADALAPLMEPLAGLKGVKEAEARLIAKAAGGTRVLDLLLHLLTVIGLFFHLVGQGA